MKIFSKLFSNGLMMLTILCIVALNANAQGIKFEHSDWDAVVAKATKEKKIIFVDLYAEWCGPCKWMAANSFTDKSVGEYFNKNFINFKIDADKNRSHPAVTQSKLEAYPTLAFYNPDGSIIKKETGAQDVEGLLSLGKSINEFVALQKSAVANYKKDPKNKAYQKDYLYLKAQSNDNSVQDVATKYISKLTNAEINDAKNVLIISAYSLDINSRGFKLMQDNLEAFAEIDGSATENYINNLIDKHIKDVKVSYNEKTTNKLLALVEVYLKDVLDRKEDEAKNASLNIKASIYKEAGMKKEYFTTMDQVIADMDDANKIAETVFGALEGAEEGDYDKLIGWAKAGVDKDSNEITNFVLAKTYAEAGKTKEAKKVCAKAKKLSEEGEGIVLKYIKALEDELN